MGWIDMHTHLLPFVDDGVQGKDECLTLLDSYAEAGFDRVVTTPHLYNPIVLTRTNHIRPMFEWAQGEAASRGIELILGCETYIGGNGDPQVIPFLNNFILLEADVASEPLFLLHHAYSLLKRGYTIILAHIERYQWFSESSTVARKLREMGVFFQCNVAGIESQDAAKWLKSGLVDVIASDNHGDVSLPKRMVTLLHKYPEVTNRMDSLFRKPTES